MYGNCLTIYEQAPAAMQERLEAEIAEWEERKRRKEEEEAEAKRKQLEQEQLAAKTATGAGGAGNSPRAEQGAVAPPDGAPGEEGSSSHTSEGAADDQSATPEAGSSDGQAAASAASEAEEDKPPDTAGEAAPATADGSAPPAAPAVEPEQPPPEPSPPQPIFAPKCLCLLSKWPFINSSRSWLMQARAAVCLTTPCPCTHSSSTCLPPLAPLSLFCSCTACPSRPARCRWSGTSATSYRRCRAPCPARWRCSTPCSTR